MKNKTESKLTLQLDTDVIEQAKDYALKQNTSLSQLVEGLLLKLVQDQTEPTLSPLVKSLSGVIILAGDDDSKNDYAGYLTEKYS
ncbi:MAG: DUF6364 family protein [Bacteroidia bacterium]